VKEAIVAMSDLAVVLQLVPYLYVHAALLKLAKESAPGEGYYKPLLRNSRLRLNLGGSYVEQCENSRSSLSKLH